MAQRKLRRARTGRDLMKAQSRILDREIAKLDQGRAELERNIAKAERAVKALRDSARRRQARRADELLRTLDDHEIRIAALERKVGG